MDFEELRKDFEKFYGPLTPREVKRLRNKFNRMAYERRKAERFALASDEDKAIIMAVGLVHLKERIGATELIEYKKGTYTRVKVKMPDDSTRRYYFNSGRWRKS